MRACLPWLVWMLASPWGLSGAAAMLALLYAAFRWRVRRHGARQLAQLDARQAARERMARELHDALLQDTQAVILHFHNASMALPMDEPARADMLRALDAADRVLADGRNHAQELHAAALDAEAASAAGKGDGKGWRLPANWLRRRRAQVRSGVEDAAP